MRLFLTCLSLSLLLVLSTIGSAWSSGINNTANNTTQDAKDDRLQKLLAEYVNWDLNLSDKQMPASNASAKQCVIKPGSVNFLADPFSRGTVTQTCKINSGSSLLFPFYIGFCDNGGAGNYGEQSFQKILACALDSDKGIVTMEGWLDGNKIIDLKVNNKDQSNLKLLYNNLPQNKYYKEIKGNNFFNLTVTNNT